MQNNKLDFLSDIDKERQRKVDRLHTYMHTHKHTEFILQSNNQGQNIRSRAEHNPYLALLARPTSELERYVRDLGGPRVWADSERFG